MSKSHTFPNIWLKLGKKLTLLCFTFLATMFFYNADIFAADSHLPLYEGDNYDAIINNNVIAENIENSSDNGIGTEQDMWGFLTEGNDLITIINIIVASVGLIWLVVLSIKFTISRGNEENITKFKQQFGWIVLGLLVVSIAEYIGFQVFNPERDILTENESVKNFSKKAEQIKTYFEILVGGIMLVVGGMSGFNLIIGAEEEDKIKQEKTFIKTFFLGFGVILLAEVIVKVFTGKEVATSYEGTFEASKSVEQGISEMVGLTNFVLTFVGGAATFMLILASLYYVTSFGDEDQMSRAKRIIIACVVAIIVAFSSFAIASFLTR